MATVEELQNQIAALTQQTTTLSHQMEEEVLRRATTTIEGQVNFVNSIALISGTLAPLSLLLLQAPVLSSIINIKLLLIGFTVLVINILFIYSSLRFLLLKRFVENKKNLSLELFQKIPKLELVAKTTSIDELVKSINDLLAIIVELQSAIGLRETNENKRANLKMALYVREVMVWGSTLFLFAGIIMIVSSFWGFYLPCQGK